MSFDEHIDELTVANTLHSKFYGSPLPVVELANGIAVPANAEYAMCAEITLEDDLESLRMLTSQARWMMRESSQFSKSNQSIIETIRFSMH